MRVRSFLAGLATTAVAASAATIIGAAPASADPTYGVPDANDIVGVGSDTIENAMDFLAEGTMVNGSAVPGYDAGKTTSDALLASFDTVGSATIVLRQGSAAITRPVGSGAGKGLLYGGGNNTDVTFARSSSALNATEVSAGLEAFPFAVDTLKMAVSGTTASHAPASLTPQQILDIYKGNITNWSDVGGTAGVIKPYVPQSGSGTYSFFNAQLQAINGGAFTYGADVDNTMHENTDDVLANDANAIAPFSVGKATLLYPTTVHLEDGFAPQRALYNVIRGTDLGNSTLQGIFGENGFICSTAARPLIEAAGFKQLATSAHGGACGGATQSPTANFTQNQQVTTHTTLSAKSKTAKHATLVATVTGASAPNGTVDFYKNGSALTTGVPLVSGQATYTTSDTPGNHTYTAVFVPASGSQFDPSQANHTVFVKAAAAITESFPAKVAHGAKAKGVVTVTLKGLSTKATGKVKVLKGTKTLVKGKLAKGKVTLKLPALKKGKNHLKAVWAGDSHGAAHTKKFLITQK